MRNVLRKTLSVIFALVFIFSSFFSLPGDLGRNSPFSVTSEAAVVDINSIMYAVREPVNCSGELTYTVYLKKGVSLSEAIMNIVFDNTVLEVIDGGEYGTEDEDGNFIQSVSGMYVSGVTVSDANVYAIGFISMSSVTLTRDKPFVFITFDVKDRRAKTNVEIRCNALNSGKDIYDINQSDDYAIVLSDTIENIVPDHTFGNLDVVNPTCEIEGYMRGLCTSCGEYVDEVIPATGHSYNNGYCILCGVENPFEYSISSDKVTITGYKGTKGDVIIPPKIDGCEVTSVGGNAFASNGVISTIEIPATVKSIGIKAFYRCLTLKAINVDKCNEYYSSVDGVLFDKESVVLIQYPSAKTDTEYTVPDSVTLINSYAFSASRKLVSVIAPNSLTEIGEYAFAYSSNMSSFTMGNGVEVIGAYAFSGCSKLSSLQLSESLTSIGKNAFENCRALAYIEIPDGITEIDSHTFYGCRDLLSAELPDSLIYIGESAFGSCTALDYLYIPQNVRSIDSTAFANCESLWCFDVAKNNRFYSAEDGILFNKDKTELVKFPALRYGNNYIVPESVNTISDRAFEHTLSLKYITILDSVTHIGDNVFYNTLATINCPDGSNAHEYAVENSLKYILFKLYEKNDTVIDYNRLTISTSVEGASNISDFLDVADADSIDVKPSYGYGGCDLLGTGSSVSVLDGGNKVDAFTIVVIGDTNGDSVVDALDAAKVANASNGLNSLDGVFAMAADHNRDDEISIEDYQAIVNEVIA